MCLSSMYCLDQSSRERITNIFLLKEFLKKFVHKYQFLWTLSRESWWCNSHCMDCLFERYWLSEEFRASVFRTCKKEAVILEAYLSQTCFVCDRTQFYEALGVSLMEWHWRWHDSVVIAISVQRPLFFLVFNYKDSSVAKQLTYLLSFWALCVKICLNLRLYFLSLFGSWGRQERFSKLKGFLYFLPLPSCDHKITVLSSCSSRTPEEIKCMFAPNQLGWLSVLCLSD